MAARQERQQELMGDSFHAHDNARDLSGGTVA
jgi:hypothetical protein